MLKQSTSKAPLRYFIVVIGGFTVDFFLYALLVSAGLSVYLANLLGFCLGAAFNVLMIRLYVFQDSRFNFVNDLLLTLLANGMMLLVGMGLLWVQIEKLAFDPYLAKLIANGLTFILNYLTRATFFRMK